MSFRCQKCHKAQPSKSSLTKKTIERRDKVYANETGEQTGKGWEIVKEINVCKKCAGEDQPKEEAKPVATFTTKVIAKPVPVVPATPEPVKEVKLITFDAANRAAEAVGRKLASESWLNGIGVGKEDNGSFAVYVYAESESDITIVPATMNSVSVFVVRGKPQVG